MKKLNIFLLMVLVCTSLQAQVSKTIDVLTAGTLSSLLTALERTTITDLTVTGNIDARDVKCMRDQITKLAVLDISAATIQAYSGIDGTDSNTASYANNALPNYSFYMTPGKISLKTFKLPNSITSIGFWAFNGCSGLNTITIGNSLSSMNGAFGQCSGVTNFVVLPDNPRFTTINGVIYNKDITSIILYPQAKSGVYDMPSSVTTLEHGAFYNCKGLSGSLTIPSLVTSISANDFYGCSGLTNINIPNSVNSIASWAFTYCSSLTSLIIPNSVNSIGSSAFRDCTSLTDVRIGSLVTSIGDVAFMNCSKIDKITISCMTPPTIYANTFMGVAKGSLFEVPIGKSSTYHAANYWSDFLNISESSFPDICGITLQISSGGMVKENNLNISNGTVLSVEKGNVKTFTIISNSGYELETFFYNGVDVKTQINNNQYTTTIVNVNTTLIVTFKKIQYRISLKDASTGVMNLLCDYGAIPSFDFSPAVGWKVNTVFYNNADVTASLVNGVYTVPAITENSLLNVAFVSTLTGAPDLVSSNVKVYSTQSEIIIDGTAEGENITLYTVNGKQLQTLKSQGSRMVFPAQNGAVYLVKTAGRTYKVML